MALQHFGYVYRFPFQGTNTYKIYHAQNDDGYVYNAQNDDEYVSPEL